MHDTTITFPELDVETILRTGVSVSYIGENYSFGLYETSSGTILYSLDLDTEWPEPGQRIYPIEFNDLGLHTILSNAYPYCTIKGNGGQDRYITQIAIWAYRQGKESFSEPSVVSVDRGPPRPPSFRPAFPAFLGAGACSRSIEASAAPRGCPRCGIRTPPSPSP